MLIGAIARHQKLEASGQTRGITQDPLLPLCQVENVNCFQCPVTQRRVSGLPDGSAVPIFLGGVFVRL